MGIAKKMKLLSSLSVLSSKTDEELMRLVRDKSDQEAFAILFNKFKGPIVGFVYGMVKNRNLAEDLTQEVFMKVFRFRESYAGDGKFTTWLWSIARNTTIDYFRKKKDFLLDDLLSPDSGEGATIESISDGKVEGPEAELIEKSDALMIRECMDKLPPKQKEALTLRVFSELSYDEIASAMNISKANVKSLIFRAKEKLIKLVEDGNEND